MAIRYNMIEELKKEGLLKVRPTIKYKEKSLHVRNGILFLETKEQSQDSWKGKSCIVLMKPWAEVSREKRKLHRECQHWVGPKWQKTRHVDKKKCLIHAQVKSSLPKRNPSMKNQFPNGQCYKLIFRTPSNCT